MERHTSRLGMYGGNQYAHKNTSPSAYYYHTNKNYPACVLNGPAGIALESGEIYAADPGRNRVQVWNTSGEWQRTVGGTFGAGDGEMKAPAAVAVSGADSWLFVADQYNGRVQRFTAAGAFVDAFGSDDLYRPVGLFWDSGARELYVSDAGLGQVQVYDEAGAWVRTLGHKEEAVGGFRWPWGMCLYGGELYVADAGRSKVLVLDPSTGALIREWGSSTVFTGPHAVTVFPDALGTPEVYVGAGTVKAFTTAGVFIRTLISYSGGAYGLVNDGTNVYASFIPTSVNFTDFDKMNRAGVVSLRFGLDQTPTSGPLLNATFVGPGFDGDDIVVGANFTGATHPANQGVVTLDRATNDIIRYWKTAHAGLGSAYTEISDIDVAGGKVYVYDGQHPCVQVYTLSTGALVAHFAVDSAPPAGTSYSGYVRWCAATGEVVLYRKRSSGSDIVQFWTEGGVKNSEWVAPTAGFAIASCRFDVHGSNVWFSQPKVGATPPYVIKTDLAGAVVTFWAAPFLTGGASSLSVNDDEVLLRHTTSYFTDHAGTLLRVTPKLATGETLTWNEQGGPGRFDADGRAWVAPYYAMVTGWGRLGMPSAFHLPASGVAVAYVKADGALWLRVYPDAGAASEAQVDAGPECDCPSFGLGPAGAWLEGTYLQDGTLWLTRSRDGGITWGENVDLGTSFQYAQSVQDGYRRVIVGFQDGALYCQVGVIKADGTYDWSSPAPTGITDCVGGFELVRRPEDGVLELFYQDTGWIMYLVRCRDLADDGSGTWA